MAFVHLHWGILESCHSGIIDSVDQATIGKLFITQANFFNI
ncbi:MAG: hypothetical protein WCG25_02270 [bacterium]